MRFTTPEIKKAIEAMDEQIAAKNIRILVAEFRYEGDAIGLGTAISAFMDMCADAGDVSDDKEAECEPTDTDE